MSTIGRDLDRLARDIIQETLDPSKKVPFDEKLDAFKALCSYHIGLQRFANKAEDRSDEDTGAISLSEIRTRIDTEGQTEQ